MDKLVKEWRRRSIRSLTKWHKYERNFAKVGEWLLTHDKITEDETATYVWRGICKSLRVKIKDRLSRASPPISNAKVYPCKKVREIAEVLFERNQFDQNLPDSSDSDQSDSSSTESEEESEDECNHKKSKSFRKKKTSRSSSDSDSEDNKVSFRKSHRKIRTKTDVKSKDSTSKLLSGISTPGKESSQSSVSSKKLRT